MKQYFYTFIFIVSLFLSISSCKKSEDNNPTETETPTTTIDEEGVNQEVASERLNAVEEETPPRAEKIETEIVFDDTTYADPESVYGTTDESNLSKLELLINGSTSGGAKLFQTESNAFSWILESVNGIAINEKEKYLFIFNLDGKYKKYQVYDKSAEWGYYYVDTDFTKIAFDYKDSKFSKSYKVTHISAKGLIIENRDERLVFKPYVMRGVDDNRFTPTRTYTSTTPATDPIDILQVKEDAVADLFYFTVSGTYAKYLLSTFTIQTKTEKGFVNVPAKDITLTGFGGEPVSKSENPVKLDGSDVKNFKLSGQISMPKTNGKYTFYFVLTDEKGQEEVESLTISVISN